MNNNILFVFLGILLLSFQFVMIGANTRLLNNHPYNLGEDFAKHAAATTKSGVVGKPGNMIPKHANTTKQSPNIINTVFRIL